MNSAYWPIIALLALSLALVFVGAPIIHGFTAIYAALLAAIVALAIPRSEAQHFASEVKPFLVIAMLPAIWMLVQILPAFSGVAHSIWRSTATAIGHPIWGSISVDQGATFVAFCRYLSLVTICAVVAATAIDRPRAEGLLMALSAVTSIAAVCLILTGALHFGWLTDARPALAAMSGQGVILAAAAIDRAVERYETRRSRMEAASMKFIRTLTASLAALGICGLALAFFGQSALSIVTAIGLAFFVVVVAARRLGFANWMMWLAIVAVTATPLMFVLAQSNGAQALITRFASAPEPLISTVERLSQDTSWAGTGAGTFNAMLRIYRPLDLPASTAAPTTAAREAIELGRPFLWLLLACTAYAIYLLLRGAMDRGRDSFYSAAAASSLTILLLESFVDATLTQTGISIVVAALLGLGIAQRAGRKLQ